MKSSSVSRGAAFAVAFLVTCGLAAGVAARPAPAADSPAAKIEPGKAIVNRTCQACHDLSQVTEARHTPQEWVGVVQRMRDNGAALSDDEAKQVQQYLAKTYSKGG